jgi:LppX_LprAFG lipoprotein
MRLIAHSPISNRVVSKSVGKLLVGGVAICLGLSVTGSAYGAKIATRAIRLQDVAKVTATSKTMQFSVTMDLSMSAGGQDLNGTIVASGKTDFANRASSTSMDLTDFMKSMAKASKQKLPAGFSSPGAMNVKVISVGKKGWISYPFLTSMLGNTDKSKLWVLIDLAAAGIDAGDLAASQGFDPTQGLEMLNAISTTGASVVGTEVIDGVKTTKYSTSLSADLFTKNLPAGQPKEAVALLESAANYPAYVWVDEQNRARRFDMTVHTFQSNVDMTMNSSYRFSKFNEPVVIIPPKASEVGDNTAFTQMLVTAAKAKKSA